MSPVSRPGFFNNGVTTACFCETGSRPWTSEALAMSDPRSDHPLAADRVQAQESSPVRDRRSNHWASQPILKAWVTCTKVDKETEALKLHNDFRWLVYISHLQTNHIWLCYNYWWIQANQQLDLSVPFCAYLKRNGDYRHAGCRKSYRRFAQYVQATTFVGQ